MGVSHKAGAAAACHPPARHSRVGKKRCSTERDCAPRTFLCPEQGWGAFFLPGAIWIFLASFTDHTNGPYLKISYEKKLPGLLNLQSHPRLPWRGQTKGVGGPHRARGPDVPRPWARQKAPSRQTGRRCGPSAST